MVNCSIMKACVGKKKIKFEKYVQKVAQKKSHAHSVKNGIGIVGVAMYDFVESTEFGPLSSFTQ